MHGLFIKMNFIQRLFHYHISIWLRLNILNSGTICMILVSKILSNSKVQIKIFYVNEGSTIEFIVLIYFYFEINMYE